MQRTATTVRMKMTVIAFALYSSSSLFAATSATPISATPNPAIVGRPVTLSISEATTTASWLIFNADGLTITSLSGNPVVFTPDKGPGGYAIFVITDLDIDLIELAVTDVSIDFDLDGTPNELETSTGTNANDAGSKSTKAVQSGSIATVSRLRIGLDSDALGKDTLHINATFNSNTVLALQNKIVAFQIGGLSRAFRLSANGKRLDAIAMNTDEDALLSIQSGKEGDLKLKFMIKRAKLAGQLRPTPIILSMFLLVGDELTAVQVPVSIKTAAGKTVVVGKSVDRKKSGVIPGR